MQLNTGAGQVNDERTYDAWGSIRAGAQQNDPNGRYCASLGHKADDETGFIYMRARFYEPSTARFLSSDPSRQGCDWFLYCANDPVNRTDVTGKAWDFWTTLGAIGTLISLVGIAIAIACSAPAAVVCGLIILAAVICAATWVHNGEDYLHRKKNDLKKGDDGSDAWERELKEMSNGESMIDAFSDIIG